ncbi:unnamed protein product [marine sediment metagenome]|uniref:Uncharacterized protein n=1 Tax=marine sediment metagenome TaxID=412755 RepID=X1HNN4_9ZZZZ
MAFPGGNHKETGGIAAYRTLQTAEFTAGAGTGNVGTFALFTVTGSVIVRIIAECTDTLVEGVGGGTIEIGITGDTATIIAQTVCTTIAANEIWHDATSDADIEALSVMADFIIVNGMDIFATIAGQNVTDGTLVFHCFWTPLGSTGNVVAA